MNTIARRTGIPLAIFGTIVGLVGCTYQTAIPYPDRHISSAVRMTLDTDGVYDLLPPGPGAGDPIFRSPTKDVIPGLNRRSRPGPQTEIDEGPQGADPFRDGWYESGGERIKLIYRNVDLPWRGSPIPGGDRDAPDFGLLNNAALTALDSNASCHAWDDRWYANRVARDNRPAVDRDGNRQHLVMLIWWNLDREEYGWVAAINTPDTWQVRSSDDPWRELGNDTRRSYLFESHGIPIEIEITDPPNREGWGQDDIWYRFGS